MNLDDAIRELRAQNEDVPQPGRLPTPAEVDTAEQQLGIRFHPDFRRYLLEASDVTCGVVEPVTITSPNSYTDLFHVAHKAWDTYGVPRDLLPICEDNADFYCMDTEGEVLFFSHNGGPSSTWPTLADWIKDVWLEEFDEE